MLVAHTYYTAGMHELAKVFVESFCFYHGDLAIPLVIDAVGVDKNMVGDLVARYPYTKVRPQQFRIGHLARRCGVRKELLLKWKDQIEKGYVTRESRVWKLLMSGEQRVQVVRDLIAGLTGQRVGEDTLVVHFDIDTLFRGSIVPIVKEMEGYTVGLKLRPKIQPVKARITNDVMAIRCVDPSVLWLNTWVRMIEKIKPMDRPVGFGQISHWWAFEIMQKDPNFKVLTLPLKYGLPGRNKEEDVVWCGNVHKLRKDNCAVVFGDELKRLKKLNREKREA